MLHKSIRKRFLLQLLLALATLIFAFSSMLYFYIEESIYDEKQNELITYAKNIVNNKAVFQLENTTPESFAYINIGITYLREDQLGMKFYHTIDHKHHIMTLIYPYKPQEKSYIKITKDITTTVTLLNKILNYIFLINIIGFLLVVIYAITLSKMLVSPIEVLTSKLANMNENLIKPININKLPLEFKELGETINHLISRLQNFVKYQKELFIGTAHELKTPLAVIKLKNQVTLIKKRDADEYIKAIKTTNKTVDEMNIIVSNILTIGRQEGAQLEKPVEFDVISFLKQKANDFKLLAENDNKILKMDFTPDGYMVKLQKTLLNQIVQNFLQNALKFTPTGKTITLKSSEDDCGLLIEVIDEGCGIAEDIDLFAPFKRQGDKSGAGLGLFLAKSAAEAIGAKISLQNRKDGIKGTVARLQLNSKLSCILPKK